MSEKFLIGLDLDGVIVDHTEPKIRAAKELGFDIAPEETPTNILEKKMGTEHYAALEKIRNEIYNTDDTRKMPTVMAGAREGLEMIVRWGVPYVLLSQRKYPEYAVTLLQHRRLWPEVFNRENAFFFTGGDHEKNAKAEELGVNIYVDDKPSVLATMTSVPRRVLFDQHDAYPPASGDDRYEERVTSWEELIPLLEAAVN